MHHLAIRRIAGFFALLAAVALLALPSSAQNSKPGKYGKTLISSSELSPAIVAKIAQIAARPTGKPGSSPSDGVSWNSDEFSAVSAGNPYKIVITTTGTAAADGETAVAWEAGWAINGGIQGSVVPAFDKTSAKAGERVRLVSVSQPISFKEDRKMVGAASLSRINNLQVDGVTIEIWSGIGDSSFVQLLMGWSPVLGGLVMLALFFWFRRS